MAKLSLHPSIRLILAMIKLSAGDLHPSVKTGWGKVILDIFKNQYPDQKNMVKQVKMPQNGEVVRWLVSEGDKVFAKSSRSQGKKPVVEIMVNGKPEQIFSPQNGIFVGPLVDDDQLIDAGAPLFSVDVGWGVETAADIGNRIFYLSLKENQNNTQRAVDSVQDFFAYISTGSEYVTDEEGNRVPRSKSTGGGKVWDFAKDSPMWYDAYAKLRENIRRRAMTKSITNQSDLKKNKSVDDAFGARGEGGDAPAGGEGRIPDKDSPLGAALDDKSAEKRFMDLIDANIPELMQSLSPSTRILFDLVYNDDIGSFSSDIKENMGQATAFADKLKNGTPEEKALYEKNVKRWSGFVGDTRKKLLQEIEDFIDHNMNKKEVEILWDKFYEDTTPKAVKNLRMETEKGKEDYQRGIDERKIARFKWMAENGTLSDKDKKSFESLSKKLKSQKVDIDAIAPVKPAEKKKKKGEETESESDGQTQLSSMISRKIARRIASRSWL